jgi:hypothetical protein
MCCPAKLAIGDDHGDNEATMHCQLEDGHEGPHEERYDTTDSDGHAQVVVQWTREE